MDNLAIHRDRILNNGFTIFEVVYTINEVEKLIFEIDSTDRSNPTFRQTDDLFAIRQFLKQV